MMFPPEMDQRANRKFRVARRADVSRLFRQGRRAGDRLIVLHAAANGLSWSRGGVGVSRRHGNAVRRNRIKRLCRAAFRSVRAELPAGWDYFIIPRSTVELTVGDIAGSVRLLAEKLTRVADGKDHPR